MNMRDIINCIQLNELKGYRNDDLDNVRGVFTNQTKNHDALASFGEFLKQKGFKVIHSGGFGIVFTRPDLQYVIKVFRGDPAYVKFVQFCQGKASKHLPKFRGSLMPILKGDIYAIRMEKLDPCPQSYGYCIGTLEEFAVSHFDPETFVDDYKYYGGNRETANFLENNLELLNILNDLKSAETKDIRFDLKPDNFMLRGDTLVITDPFYSHTSWLKGIA